MGAKLATMINGGSTPTSDIDEAKDEFDKSDIDSIKTKKSLFVNNEID